MNAKRASIIAAEAPRPLSITFNAGRHVVYLSVCARRRAALLSCVRATRHHRVLPCSFTAQQQHGAWIVAVADTAAGLARGNPSRGDHDGGALL